MTRFELATPRPPDAYSNRTELHPETWAQKEKDWVLFRFAGAKVEIFFDTCKLFRTFVPKFSSKSVFWYEISHLKA